MGKHGATVPSVRMITLSWPALKHIVNADVDAKLSCSRSHCLDSSRITCIIWVQKPTRTNPFFAVRPCFNDLGRPDTFRTMSPDFDLPIAPLQSQSSCAAASRGALCRNPGSRRKRVQLDHGAAMSCVDERNQTSKQESISTSS